MPRTLPHQLDRNPAASRENTGAAIPKPPPRMTLARLPVSFGEEGKQAGIALWQEQAAPAGSPVSSASPRQSDQ